MYGMTRSSVGVLQDSRGALPGSRTAQGLVKINEQTTARACLSLPFLRHRLFWHGWTGLAANAARQEGNGWQSFGLLAVRAQAQLGHQHPVAHNVAVLVRQLGHQQGLLDHLAMSEVFQGLKLQVRNPLAVGAGQDNFSGFAPNGPLNRLVACDGQFQHFSGLSWGRIGLGHQGLPEQCHHDYVRNFYHVYIPVVFVLIFFTLPLPMS